MGEPDLSPPNVRLELGFGWSSLLVDPDVGEGYGGGIFIGWIRYRVGVEVAAFVGVNPYDDRLGQIGSLFFAGALTLGPVVHLTRPGADFSMTLEMGMGGYGIVSPLQGAIWTLGISGGTTIGYRLAPWFGIGLKLRYHLFNLTTFGSGPDLLDLKSVQRVGVIDRLELPAYVAFYF